MKFQISGPNNYLFSLFYPLYSSSDGVKVSVPRRKKTAPRSASISVALSTRQQVKLVVRFALASNAGSTRPDKHAPRRRTPKAGGPRATSPPRRSRSSHRKKFGRTMRRHVASSSAAPKSELLNCANWCSASRGQRSKSPQRRSLPLCQTRPSVLPTGSLQQNLCNGEDEVSCPSGTGRSNAAACGLSST